MSVGKSSGMKAVMVPIMDANHYVIDVGSQGAGFDCVLTQDKTKSVSVVTDLKVAYKEALSSFKTTVEKWTSRNQSNTPVLTAITQALSTLQVDHKTVDEVQNVKKDFTTAIKKSISTTFDHDDNLVKVLDNALDRALKKHVGTLLDKNALLVNRNVTKYKDILKNVDTNVKHAIRRLSEIIGKDVDQKIWDNTRAALAHLTNAKTTAAIESGIKEYAKHLTPLYESIYNLSSLVDRNVAFFDGQVQKYSTELNKVSQHAGNSESTTVSEDLTPYSYATMNQLWSDITSSNTDSLNASLKTFKSYVELTDQLADAKLQQSKWTSAKVIVQVLKSEMEEDANYQVQLLKSEESSYIVSAARTEVLKPLFTHMPSLDGLLESETPKPSDEKKTPTTTAAQPQAIVHSYAVFENLMNIKSTGDSSTPSGKVAFSFDAQTNQKEDGEHILVSHLKMKAEALKTVEHRYIYVPIPQNGNQHIKLECPAFSIDLVALSTTIQTAAAAQLSPSATLNQDITSFVDIPKSVLQIHSSSKAKAPTLHIPTAAPFPMLASMSNAITQ